MHSGRTKMLAAFAAVAIGALVYQASPSTAAPSVQPDPAFSVQTAIPSTLLKQPVAIATASDGRIFVAELSGIIEVFHGVSDTHPKVFANLSNEVYSAQGYGMLGMTLDPHFPSTPYVYVLYSRDSATKGGPISATKDTCPTHATTGCVRYGRLARLTANGDKALPAVKVLVDDWCNQFTHHIGALHFGSDGYLYASGGDGATEAENGTSVTDYGQFGNACGDPPAAAGTDLTAPTAQGGSLRAQDLQTSGDPAGLDGALIRINPATGAAAPGNPNSASTDPNARRIIAEGLRNPFRFAIRPGTRDVYIADPGLTTFEEIDRIPNATGTTSPDFGWPCYEGSAPQPMWQADNLDMCNALYASHTAVSPTFSYRDDGNVIAGDGCPPANGSAVTGISFYTGSAYPAAYHGALFFSDWGRQCLWAAPAGTNGVPKFAARTLVARLPATGVTDIEPGPNGDLLLVDVNNSTIYELHYA
jgi:glucose/arabinose dehydrogenase